MAKEYKISFRVSKNERKNIQQKAEKKGLSVSDYLRNILINKKEMKTKSIELPVHNVSNVVQCQELVNYIKCHYMADEESAERMEALWSNLF